MEYLIRVSEEDIQVPIQECSVGQRHYTEIQVEPITLDVKPQRPLRLCLESLLSKLEGQQDSEEFWSDDCLDRINLLWRHGQNPLEISILDVLRSRNFDFFVSADNAYASKPERFSSVRGNVLYHGQKMPKTMKVQELFGNAKYLCLTNLSSRGAELRLGEREDFILSDWEEMQREEYIEKRFGELSEYLLKTNEIRRTNPDSVLLPDILQVFLDEDGSLSAFDLTNALGSMKTYYCGCYFEDDNREEEIAYEMEKLETAGILLKAGTSGLFLLAQDYRKRDLQQELKEAGLELSSNDGAETDILLFLGEQSMSLMELQSELLNRGYRFQNGIRDVEERIETLSRKGIVRRREDEYFLNPSCVFNPNQLTLQLS